MTDLRENVKWTLADQALRSKARLGSKCFSKILFMDKYTFLLAKLYGVFQFRMYVTSGDKVKFCFADRGNDEIYSTQFKLSYARAEKLFKLLDPEVFRVFAPYGDENSQFFNLMSLASGKLGFEICELEIIPDILKIHWKRIGELDCSAASYKLIDEWAVEPKEFDKLKVDDITDDSQLAMVLKQKAAILDLSFWNSGWQNLPLSSAVINDTTKKCCLKFDYRHMNSIVPTVNLIAGACKSLERFELCVDKPWNFERVNDFNHLLGTVAGYYGKYAELIDFIKGFEFASSLDFHTPDLDLTLSPPSDWKDRLKMRLGVEESAVEIRESRYHEEAQIRLVDKDRQSKFKFSTVIRCEFEEDNEDTASE